MVIDAFGTITSTPRNLKAWGELTQLIIVSRASQVG